MVTERTSLLARQREDTERTGSPPATSHNHIVEDEDQGENSLLVEIGIYRFFALVICIWLTWFIGSFDSTLMASSHPAISTYFSASNAASWFSTSFLLTSCSFSPVFAMISDTFGRRIPLLVTLVAFFVGILWSAVAPTVLQFILARALCGFGAGPSLSQTVTLISDLVPLRKRGTFISYINLAYGMGSSLGAAIGGFLAETIGWRWAFGIQVPAIALVIFVVYLAVPTELGPQYAKHNPRPLLETVRSFDLSGSLFLTLVTACVISLLDLGGNFIPWTHPIIPVCLVLFVVLGVILLQVEKRADKPIVPLGMLLRAPGSQIVFSNLLNCMSISTVFFNSPLFFQTVLLDTPSVSGGRLMAPFLVGMVAAFAAGNIISWTGKLRPLILLGYLLILAGLLAMSIVDGQLPSYIYSGIICLPLIGQGLAFPTLIVAQLAINSQEDVAIATSTLLLCKNIGNVMGVAVSGLVSQNTLVYYLERLVQGPEKWKVIEEVRKAVEAVRYLQPPYQAQVIDANLRAMHLTFLQGAVTAVVALLIVLPMKLPKIKSKANDLK